LDIKKERRGNSAASFQDADGPFGGYGFTSSLTSSFTTPVAKQPTLWSSASLKTHSHGVKHMVKLQRHGSPHPPLMELLVELFSF
jgi:hypothetical protein